MLNCMLLFLDMSGGEMIVIALVALLVLGPQKMGDFARKAGKMMNEVRRVSSDFKTQLNEETGALQNEVHNMKDSLRDAANNIRDEFVNAKQEVNNDPDTHHNTSETSDDTYNLSQDPSEAASHAGVTSDENSFEQTGTKDTLKEKKTKKNPTSKQANNPNP